MTKKDTTIDQDYFTGKYYEKVYIPTTMNFERSILWMANYYKVIKDLFPDITKYKDKKILEIGSSYCGLIEIFNRKGFKYVVASDVSDKLRPEGLKNEFLFIDLLNNSIVNEYDLIIALGVLEHIDDSEKVVNNISKMLKKHGVFIFAVPYPLKKHLFDQYHTNMQPPYYWTNLYNRMNFSLKVLQNVTFVPYIWRWGIPMYIKLLVETNLAISDTFFVFKKNN